MSATVTASHIKLYFNITGFLKFGVLDFFRKSSFAKCTSEIYQNECFLYGVRMYVVVYTNSNSVEKVPNQTSNSKKH